VRTLQNVGESTNLHGMEVAVIIQTDHVTGITDSHAPYNYRRSVGTNRKEETMDLHIPGIKFLVSSIPLEFETDGYVTHIMPVKLKNIHPDQILVIPQIHAYQFKLNEISGISLFDKVTFPNDINLPALYDGTQTLHGKSILILMLNGWGDMILIQPALRNFHNMISAEGPPPHITVGCNWIRNFPYPNVPYIQEVRPNILTLKELCSYDIVVNLTPVHSQRTAERSMRDLFTEILRISSDYDCDDPPSISPNPKKVRKLRPLFDQLREETGKKLLCANWKSRLNHKSASPELMYDIVTRLYDTYQPVIFKDEGTSQIMQGEIRRLNAPIINLSSVIYDYHDTIAALSLVDAFISVDTGIVHAAGALGIPGVALFGPFPPEAHVPDYKSIVPIRASYRGKTCNVPCLELHKGCAEVNYSPEDVSPCLDAIDPADVVDGLERITGDSHYQNSISKLYSQSEKTSKEAAYVY